MTNLSHGQIVILHRPQELTVYKSPLTNGTHSYRFPDSRLVFSYYDRTSNQWKRGTWSRTIRNTVRRGTAESLLEERL